MVTNALWVNGLSAQDARLNIAGLLARSSASPLDVRKGVVYTGSVGSLIAARATMSVTVSALHFVGLKATSSGPYLGCVTGDTVVNLTAAPASGSRIDVVYVMQRDSASSASPDGSTAGEVGVATGTAGVTPSKPAIPVGAVELGTVTVGVGATKTSDAQVTIAVTALFTTTHGAPIPVRTKSERDSTLTPYSGLQVMRLDKGGLVQRYDGTKWRGARSYAATYSVDPDNSTGFATVTHGAGFTPGAVVLTGQTSGFQYRADAFAATTFRVQQLVSDGGAGGSVTNVNAVLYEAED
jgi:hypothetical protein